MCHKKDRFSYNFLTHSLHTVDKTTAIGTEIKIPTVPKIDRQAQIENKSQTGCIPVLLPIRRGVIKFESMNGITKYNATTITYWYELRQSKDVANVVMRPIIAPKNGAIFNTNK